MFVHRQTAARGLMKSVLLVLSVLVWTRSVQSQVDVGRQYVPPPATPATPPDLINLEALPTDPADLSLSSLLQLACEHNPTLQQARLHVDGELGKAIEAGLYPNPTVMYVGEQIGAEGTPGEFQGGAIRQEFPTAGKLRLSRSKYLQRARVAEFLAVAQQYRVCNDVRIHFWRTLGQQRIVEIRRNLVQSAEDSVLTAREMYNAGQTNAVDVRRANISLQRARLDLMQAENVLREAFGQLTSLIGVELGFCAVVGDLGGNSDDIEFDTAWARIASESPELLAARAKLNADQITLRRERVEPVPNIVIQGATGYNYEVNETTAAAQVAIEVPIFDRNQGTIRQARADLSRQWREIRRVELDLRSRLFQQFQRYVTAHQRYREFDEVILPEAKEAYRLQLESYKEDRLDWPAVLESQRLYFDLQHQQIENLVALRENETLIVGFLLHGGLMAAPNPTPPGHIDAIPKPR